MRTRFPHRFGRAAWHWVIACGLLAGAVFFTGGIVVQADPAAAWPSLAWFVPGLAEQGEAAMRKQAETAQRDGNFRDAYDLYEKLILDAETDPRLVGGDLRNAWQCLARLNRVKEIDALLEKAVDVHADNWRLLQTAAELYVEIPHQGFKIAGTFERGPHRGGGEVVNSYERDRVRALQLMRQAMKKADQDDRKDEVAQFYLKFAQLILGNRGYGEAWRLQALTDLETLPDYEPGWGYYGGVRGAPVDEQNKPVLYTVPASFDKAANDGQRWRWCLTQAVEMDPNLRDQVDHQFASFLYHQFGVHTMADYGWFFRGLDASDDDRAQTWALHKLSDDETIARLATGIQRFSLPDEFNYIKIWQRMAENPKTSWGRAALSQLVEIYLNRRQYDRAAEALRTLIAGAQGREKENLQRRLDQIVGNWGRFEPRMTQPAGKGATVDFRFRNGDLVTFTAWELKIDTLLDDVKAYLKSNPGRVDWNKIQIDNIGYDLVRGQREKYRGEQVAKWDLKLEPRPNHFDRRITVTTPLQKAGAYLLEAKMADGNTSFIVLWVADTAIVKKPLSGRQWIYVADAVSGDPVPKANVEFFGWRQRRVSGQTYVVETKNFAAFTDENGQVIVDKARVPDDYQWLIIARTDSGRLAHLGYTGIWYPSYYDAQYNAIKVYTITDRPVYRPAQKVHYKFWVRHAQYDKPDESQFAGKGFRVELRDPQGTVIAKKEVTADAYGGFEGEYDLPEDAKLGVYGLSVWQGNRQLGGGSFRVEEYKKPEFEVVVEAPSKPVQLGETVKAKVSAKYYFGSPVTKAKVKYKIERTGYTEKWYPVMPFDWLYGAGYWWFAYDYPWYPGWVRWGCVRPYPSWWPVSPQPPELVAEAEVPIGPDGTVELSVDTALAKLMHPDQDHRYSITVEVTDQSRRTIVGTGTVTVTRDPFKVYVWLPSGYYRAGDVIPVHSMARTPNGEPVEGKGKLVLYGISYKDGQPVETPLAKWDMDPGPTGEAVVQIRAAKAGQYRLSHTVTDKAGHTIEGGYIFTIIGDDFVSDRFRFNDLELVPDKADYKPGDTVRLQVNTNRRNATVLLFVRPANGVYLPPKVLHLKGKSTVVPIEVTAKDMPNFFVEAVTLADGRVFTETREIFVPPAKRVLDVTVEPSKKEYLPGEKAEVKVTLKTLDGKPFVGSTVVAIYDKAVEYVSGGSNVGDIKKFFWEWRRRHHPQTEHTLSRGAGNMNPPGKPGMSNLGVFGATVADEEGIELEEENLVDRRQLRGAAAGYGGFGGAMPMAEAAMADGMPAPMAAMAPGANALAKSRAVAAAPAEQQGPAAVVTPTIRKEFADTALWVGALETDGDGTATVRLDMPQNLTTWKINVWAMGHGTRVGEGHVDVVTRKNIIVRLQAPRFFVETDEVVLSAVVHNYLKQAKDVTVKLDLKGGTLQPLDDLVRQVRIDSNGEARVDWRVKVRREGRATVRMSALTDVESDAMEMQFPCYVHGVDKMVSYSGWIRPDKESLAFRLNVPEKRRPETTRLEVRYSPTLAGAMIDALPYLLDYPYGCTEQTLNRFVPAVVTQKVLLEMGVDLEEIARKRTNLNAQEIGDDTERAKQWKRYDRNPVFDTAEMQKIVNTGVQRLTEMQLSDGGWGWFSGYGEHSWPHTTAVVVHGLQIARENDVALVPGVLERGIEWLKRYQARQVELLQNAEKKLEDVPKKYAADNLDAFIYMVLVDAGAPNAEMKRFLYRDRLGLSVYSLAMFGLALDKEGDLEKRDMVMRNINQYVVQDDENQTAWLNMSNWSWWSWYGSETEAMAYYLKLLARTDPQGELAPRLVKYLLNNRKHATYWNSTRDTALVVEAFADYIRASGEDKPQMTVEVYLDGELQKAVEITPETLFSFDNKFVVEGEALTAGEHTVELRRKGSGPLYANAYLSYFSLEDFIPPAGLEIKVERKYYRLERVDATAQVAGSRGQVIDQKVEKYRRIPLENLDEVTSGDLIEIELEIESKNDYEYIVFEDRKAAGFEPVDLRSGYNGNALGAYVEFRDERVVFFVRRLARGNHSVSYRVRAEIPGKFSALPTNAEAMYAPELRANSSEIKLRIADRPIADE
ncbi:hypothetical protein JCM19992_08710 [Thermostilla marina]